MLRDLAKLFSDFNLFMEAASGTEYVRARIVKDFERPSTAEELGTAPPAKALASRMSPAGISMFYAACEDDTAVLETYEHERKESNIIALARFQALRHLILLDLTNLPPIPSQFDFESRPERPSIAFLRAFVTDFTKPIKRDQRVHTAYVPTQIVTEFVRYRLRTPDNRPVDGIVYGSARNRGSKAVVVFADPEHCGPRADRKWSDPEPFLELTAVRYAAPREFEHLWS